MSHAALQHLTYRYRSDCTSGDSIYLKFRFLNLSVLYDIQPDGIAVHDIFTFKFILEILGSDFRTQARSF